MFNELRLKVIAHFVDIGGPDKTATYYNLFLVGGIN
jgi:hypothetical protein